MATKRVRFKVMEIEEKALKLAKKAAREAGKKIVPLFGKHLAVKEKGDAADIYTEADLLSDETILSILSSGFADFNYLSEERQFIDRGSEFTWVVDPVDGSIPFVTGLDYWGISIGLLKNNKPVVGVIYFPLKSELFSARWSNGSFLNGKRVAVSKKSEYSQAIIGFDVGHLKGRKGDITKGVLPQIEKVRYMPCLGCAVLGHAMTARGIYDAYLEYRTFIWDCLAGALIIQEAGGKVTDQAGKPLDWTKHDNYSLIASNGLIHKDILKVINSKKSE